MNRKENILNLHASRKLYFEGQLTIMYFNNYVENKVPPKIFESFPSDNVRGSI
jgi:hypothetical protein